MASEEIDRADIDRLVKGLKTPAKPPAPRPVPGRRWSTATLLMPPARKERRDPFAFASAISIPGLPKVALPAIPRIPALHEAQWGTLSVRTFVALGVLFSAAMRYWPYAHAWSWGLLGYMAAIMLVVVTGIWGAKLTWDLRLPAAHTISIGTVVWGLGLIAAEWVPRIVYV